MNLIEEYQISAEGYHPFLIRDGWQVAQLNYMPEQDIENIRRLDVHHLTDEVFILLKGKAVLIGADLQDNGVRFETKLMQPGRTYNIPRGTWHNIAMQKGCETIIVEKSDTHISDFEHFELGEAELQDLKNKVDALFKAEVRLS